MSVSLLVSMKLMYFLFLSTCPFMDSENFKIFSYYFTCYSLTHFELVVFYQFFHVEVVK